MASFTHDPSVSDWNVPADVWLKQHPQHAWHNIATSGLVFNTAARSSSSSTSSTSSTSSSPLRMLLLQRAPHDSMPLQWEAPGGAVDPGETVLRGCAREVLEESGLVVQRVVRAVEEGIVFTNRTGSVTFGKVVFEVDVEEGGDVRLDPEEHVDWAWVTEEDVRMARVKGREVRFAGEGMKEVLLKGFRLRQGGDAGEMVTSL